ncbi:hypothetical protein M514_06513, partial [Trichuris suis]
LLVSTVLPLVKVGGATYKSDVIISKEGKCWTMDIYIPYENKDSLARRHKEKCQKYHCLSEAAHELTVATEFSTLALVTGAGGWCRSSDKSLQELGLNLSQNKKSLVCSMALEKTTRLLNWFMRGSST